MRLIAAICLFCAATSASAEGLAEYLDALGGEPCGDSGMTCVTVKTPLNHFGNDPSATIDITYSVSLAGGKSYGTIFYVVGGPGYAGNQLAEGYLEAFDYALLDYYDIVFFDQRGMGDSQGLNCPVAQAVADQAPLPLDQPETTLAVAESYVRDCLAELGPVPVLPYLGTDQAIRDLDLFRQKIGAPKVWIYGESYGTQFAQAYATAFPDAVSGVILDGTVDLNLSLQGFVETYALASEGLLKRLLQACDALPACHDDMANSAVADYQSLRDQLAKAPIEVLLPLSDGSTGTHKLTESLFLTSAFYAMYGTIDRADFLRALAQSSRGDHTAMLHLGYWNMGVDPLTGETDADPSWFGAAYTAVNCADYPDESGGDPAAAARRILADAQSVAASYPNFAEDLVYDRLVCAFWPYHGPATRPEPFAGSANWPTLVLNADADPITPVSMARSVWQNAQNASLVIMKGGPHVIWGRGLACPDVIVNRLLAGEAPDGKVQYCEQDLIEDYVPLTLLEDSEQRDPLSVAQAVATELEMLIPLQVWDGESDLRQTCPLGGTLVVTAGDYSERYSFDACAFWPGITITGAGSLDDDDSGDDGIWLNLSVKGPASGDIAYVLNESTEAERISGTWDGKPIE
jgi:pimeloyl-ACP methyl ester carboxylesterase